MFTLWCSSGTCDGQHRNAGGTRQPNPKLESLVGRLQSPQTHSYGWLKKHFHHLGFLCLRIPGKKSFNQTEREWHPATKNRSNLELEGLCQYTINIHSTYIDIDILWHIHTWGKGGWWWWWWWWWCIEVALNHPTSAVPTPPSTSLTFSRVAPPLFGLRYQANGETAAPNASKEEKTQLGHPSFRDMQWTWGLAYCNYMVRFGDLHEFGRFWKFECAVVLG